MTCTSCKLNMNDQTPCEMNMFYPPEGTPVPMTAYAEPYQAPIVWNWETFVIGFVTGGLLALMFSTRTGRSIMGASGERVERRIRR